MQLSLRSGTRAAIPVALIATGLLVLGGGSAQATACTSPTISWTGGGDGTTWSQAANWNASRVPAATDLVCIPGTATSPTVVLGSSAVTVRGLDATRPLRISGGSLAVAETGALTSVLVDGGELGGAGVLSVSGTLRWTGGQLGGTGTLRALPGSTVQIDYSPTQGSPLVRDGLDVLLEGSTSWVQGHLGLYEGATITNSGTLTLAGTEHSLATSGAGAGLYNPGTIEKTAGTGVATLGPVMSNPGVIRASAGELQVTAGYDAASRFGGILRGVAPGRLTLANGTFRLPTGAVLDNVRIATAVEVLGQAQLTGSSVISAGQLGGTGELRSPAGSTLRIDYPSTAGSLLLRDGVRLVLAGDTAWAQGGIGMYEGSTLTNTGTLTMSDGAQSVGVSGAGAGITNTGTIEKTAGTGVASLNPILSNTGLIRATAGRLELSGRSDAQALHGGTLRSVSPGQLALVGGIFTLADATVLDNIQINGATVATATTAQATGSTTLSGGELGGAGVLSVSGTLRWTGGQLGGTGTLRALPGSTVQIDYSPTQGSPLVRDGLDVLLEGSTSWVQGHLGLYEGATITNSGTLTLAGTEHSLATSGAGAGLYNPGTIEKTAGTGVATLGPVMSNPGVIRASAGELQVTAGYDAASRFGGILRGVAPGRLTLANGTFRLPTGAVLDNVRIATAVEVLGQAQLTGSSVISAGQLGGTGELRSPAGSTLRIDYPSTAGSLLLRDGVRLVLAGDTAWAQGGIGMYEGSTLTNTGTLTMSDGAQSVGVSGAGAGITNTGTIEKTAGTGVASLNPILSNTGLIRATAGRLELSGRSDAQALHGGTLRSVSPGQLALVGGIFTLADATVLDNIQINGATVATATTAQATGSTTLSGGELGGAGVLSVSGTLRWTGGQLGGTGTLRALPGSTVQIDYSPTQGSPLVRDGLDVLLEGSTSWVQGHLGLYEGATITNSGTLTLADGAGSSGASGAGAGFANSGTIEKTSGTGVATLGPLLASDGAITASAGQLELLGLHEGTPYAGTARSVAPGVVVFRSGGFTLANATVLDGVRVDGALLATAKTARVVGDSLLASGSLGGSGTVTVSGSLTWTGGALTGPGTVRTVAGSTLTLDQPTWASATLQDGLALVLNGSTFLKEGGLLLYDGASLTNSGVLELTGTGPQQIHGYNRTLLHNTGTLRKTTGSDTAAVDVPLDNDGVVQSDAGMLRIGHLTNYSSSAQTLTGGSYVARAGLELPVQGLVTNAGRLVVDGASAALTAGGADILPTLTSNTAAGSLTVTGGAAATLPSFRNAGRVTVADGSTLTAAAYTQPSGTTMLSGAASALAVPSGQVVAIAGGVLTGDGQVQGSVRSAALVRPGGAAPGVLRISGGYVQTSTGRLEARLAGSGTAELRVGQAASLAGTLSLVTAPAFSPVTGTRYSLVTAPSTTGTFGTVSGTALADRRQYVVSYTPSGVVADVVQESETQTVATTQPGEDGDADGIADATDNCPSAANSDQRDADGDAVGDACDAVTDVDNGSALYPYVQRLLDAKVTAGCAVNGTTIQFCPGDKLSRRQLAVLLLRAAGVSQDGSNLPAYEGTFADVEDSYAARFVEELHRRGVTAGCGQDATGRALFCPDGEPGALTRQQIAIFLLRAAGVAQDADELPAYDGRFADVPATVGGQPNYAAPFMQYLHDNGIADTCGVDAATGKALFCPVQQVTRGHFAELLGRAFPGRIGASGGA